MLVLGVAFASNDWRLAYTVGHARPDIAWPFRVAGVWAGPEGSLLLWTTMLSCGALLCAYTARTTALPTRLMAALTSAYGIALLTVAYPFERLAAPPGAGTGLTPVLEHPAMVWHPPILYLGLVGVLVPVALLLGTDGRAEGPPSATGPLLHLTLAALTAGLATGSNWAYVELGWGGYWAWDPIENAGLVAWLLAASLIHRFPARKAPAAHAATVGVAVIWATTITRTGVLNSVHAFADQPTLRAVLLTIAVGFTVACGVIVVRSRRSTIAIRGAVGDHRMRSTAAVVVVAAAAVVVAVGTYEPAIEMLIRSNPFVLSGRFYTMLLWPVAVVGCLARIRVGVATTAAQVAATVGAVAAMVMVGAAVGAFGLVLAAAAGGVVGAAVTSGKPAERLAHAGMGLLLIGVVGTTASTRTTVVALIDQEAPTTIGPVIHRGVQLVDRPGTTEAVATLEVVDSTTGQIRTFQPKLVSYARTGASSAEIDTDRGWLVDTQVVLIDGDADRATYRLNRQPRIALVWLGAALATLGLATAGLAARRTDQVRSEPCNDQPTES